MLYGKQTSQAINNFPISGWRMPEEFIKALALIKEHSAIVNGELGEIPKDMAKAIAASARSLKEGEHRDQFPVDVFQTGSGTSTNMNMNEVVAALAMKRGQKKQGRQGNVIHPNDHVNRCQSSNDVIPTALQISVVLETRDKLIPAIESLVCELTKKAKEFHGVIKTARTHLVNAVPVRLGDEFKSYSALCVCAKESLAHAISRLCVLPLGGTAAGTGINAHPKFAEKVIAAIKKETGLPFSESSNHISAQSCPLSILAFGAALKELAVALTKIANDIRLMAAFGELTLPALQPGSSIMPGKVNTVLCESIEQVSAWVIGADMTVTQAIAASSRFELCTAYPLVASTLHTGIHLLTNVINLFGTKCVIGIKANRDGIRANLDRNPMIITPLAKEIGYEKAAEIIKESVRSGETILNVAIQKTKIPRNKLEKILDSKTMV